MTEALFTVWSINFKKNSQKYLMYTHSYQNNDLCKYCNSIIFFFYYLVVPFTEKFEPLGSLVHKNSIQVTRLHRADLYGFLTPAHNLIRMDISWKTRNRRKTDGEFCNQYSSALICNIQNGHKRSVIHRRISQAVEMKSPLGSMKVGEAYRQRWASLPTAAPRPW